MEEENLFCQTRTKCMYRNITETMEDYQKKHKPIKAGYLLNNFSANCSKQRIQTQKNTNTWCSSVQFSKFSKHISIAQLSRMSHCAPEATLNPICLKFTPETVVSNVFVAQVCWKAVPDTCPGNSKAPVTKCCVCVEQHTINRWTSEAGV